MRDPSAVDPAIQGPDGDLGDLGKFSVSKQFHGSTLGAMDSRSPRNSRTNLGGLSRSFVRECSCRSPHEFRPTKPRIRAASSRDCGCSRACGSCIDSMCRRNRKPFGPLSRRGHVPRAKIQLWMTSEIESSRGTDRRRDRTRGPRSRGRVRTSSGRGTSYLPSFSEEARAPARRLNQFERESQGSSPFTKTN